MTRRLLRDTVTLVTRKDIMKILLFVIPVALLAGCGAEVATTAATSAAVKKQELEAGKQTKETMEKKIDQATQAIQRRAAEQGNVDK